MANWNDDSQWNEDTVRDWDDDSPWNEDTLRDWNDDSQWNEDDHSRRLSMINEELTQYEAVGALVGHYCEMYMFKQPCRTSEQTGNLWVQDIMNGHDDRCPEMFRVDKHVFHLLCTKLEEHGLRKSRYIGIEEVVAMFLNTIAHGQCNRMIQERFQRSGETVSRHFHNVLQACLSLSSELIRPVDPTFRGTHRKIENDPRYYPFFKDAIGAIDGTHIPCVVPAAKRDRFIGRKGNPSQNVMAVCDWDMCFTFVLAGWEGSAHDARIFDSAITNSSLNFPHPPPGKYYLVDAGYPTPNGYLGPYRSERYHLPDFRRQVGFRNSNEAFNYYHSSLRCTIERTFGVWKNRFQILRNMRSYDFQTQVYLVCATMAIHNLIRRHSSFDFYFQQAEDGNVIGEHDQTEASQPSPSNVNSQSSSHMNR
ncbi:putative nuclease HARBI1, partial [Neltuma alba]|uniref:putative nuclease HARBI1 n=1 Tax=Neltuma alba TaxID=207710 RepID=UPI0010A3BA87